MKQIEWGITHHSIMYDGWKRLNFFLRDRLAYEKLKEEIISPVTSISCDYKATSTFADEFLLNYC